MSFLNPLQRVHWKYRSLLWNLRIRHRTEPLVLDTRQGKFVLPIDANDAMSRHLFCRREFELDLINASLRYLRKLGKCPPAGTGTVLDIGANNGVISIGMLSTGQFEHAIAIEADPHNFRLLQDNVAANDLEQRFVCLNYAAGAGPGELEFELSGSNFGDHRVRIDAHQAAAGPDLYDESQRRIIRVPSESVDQLLSDLPHQPSLVWIDVQGFEGYVFQGAERLLANDIPVMAEVWPYGLARSGMTEAAFCQIASGYWSEFCLERRGRFSRQPIAELATLLNTLSAKGGAFQNVIFLK